MMMAETETGLMQRDAYEGKVHSRLAMAELNWANAAERLRKSFVMQPLNKQFAHRINCGELPLTSTADRIW